MCSAPQCTSTTPLCNVSQVSAQPTTGRLQAGEGEELMLAACDPR